MGTDRQRVLWRTLLALALGLTVPLAVAVGYYSVRGSLPNVDAGLGLLVVIMAVGALGRRSAVVVAAVSAALWFAYFDTSPYEVFAISARRDVETTWVLAAVGLVAGELAVRVARQRVATRAGTDRFARVRDAAALLATSDELVLSVGAVAGELRRLLGLHDCWFEAGPLPAGARVVQRDGTLSTLPRARRLIGRGAGGAESSSRWDHVALPVWGQGRLLGAYILWQTPGVALDREPGRLEVAVTLADQVGAALAAQAPPDAPVDPSTPLVPGGPPAPGLVWASGGRAPVGSGVAGPAARVSTATPASADPNDSGPDGSPPQLRVVR